MLRVSIHWRNWENDQRIKEQCDVRLKHVMQSALSEHNIERTSNTV